MCMSQIILGMVNMRVKSSIFCVKRKQCIKQAWKFQAMQAWAKFYSVKKGKSWISHWLGRNTIWSSLIHFGQIWSNLIQSKTAIVILMVNVTTFYSFILWSNRHWGKWLQNNNKTWQEARSLRWLAAPYLDFSGTLFFNDFY